MMIGIHETKGSFSDRWIEYCKRVGISYKLVDCYRSDIIDQLSECDALMWHFNHKSPKASKFAKQLLFSIIASGKKIFPDFNTSWHFDDKVGQKYLLESIGAPVAHADVFYSLDDACRWAERSTFPKVFKLRNGAGSDNVKLVRSKRNAHRLIKKAFRSGFKQYEGWSNLKERYRKFCLGKTTLWDVVKGIIRLFHTTDYARVTGKEIGYIYFQDFIPGNDHDIRVIVIGDKAFAIKRMVRKNDFRASGSGFIYYGKENFNDDVIRISFEVSEKLKVQCMAYDFVFQESVPLIIEISYGFAKEGYDSCPGYWDRDMKWHEGSFNPYGWMVDDLVVSIERKEEKQ
jgi:glutathione synthase/RimK-type ligase-like ATP-grasp enzyme